MAPLICRVINSLGEGVPNAHVTLDRLLPNQSGLGRNVTLTQTDGFTHFWSSKSETSRSGWARILEDNDAICGLLNFHTNWGVIPIKVELAGERSHYVLIQLFDPSTYQVQHFEFVTPVATIQRRGQWSAAEDEILIKLRRDGFNSQEIYDSRRLNDRSLNAIMSRAKALSSRMRNQLLRFAWLHHSEELCSHEPIRDERTSSETGFSRPQSPAPEYIFVLDNHSQFPEVQRDPEIQQNAEAGTIAPSTPVYHDLVWVNEDYLAMEPK